MNDDDAIEIVMKDKNLREPFLFVAISCINELGRADGVSGVIGRRVFYGDSDEVNLKRLRAKKKRARR